MLRFYENWARISKKKNAKKIVFNAVKQEGRRDLRTFGTYFFDISEYPLEKDKFNFEAEEI